MGGRFHLKATIIPYSAYVAYFLMGSCPLVGVSLLIQDSEIAETFGVSSPKQTEPPVRVSDQLQSSQDNRRRASTGSSSVSDAGSTNEVDNDSRIQYDHSFNKSYGMHTLQFYGWE